MYKRISIDVKTQNNMTIEQYTYLVAKYGEETATDSLNGRWTL